jgi:hypothetical protein
MKITSLRIAGIRCFEDTGKIELSPFCNIFIGVNNAGKSTLLKGILALQGFPFSNDLRPNSSSSFHCATLSDIDPNDFLQNIQSRANPLRAIRTLKGAQPPSPPSIVTTAIVNDGGIFSRDRPNQSNRSFSREAKGPRVYARHHIANATESYWDL